MIQDPQGFHQRVLFEGIRYGKCMPTDIDAAMEFGGKALVLYELKYGDAEVPRGQLLLLERLVDAWAKDGRKAVLFICRHKTKADEDIMLKDAIVTDVYFDGRMRKPGALKTAWERTRDFLAWAGVET